MEAEGIGGALENLVDEGGWEGGGRVGSWVEQLVDG